MQRDAERRADVRGGQRVGERDRPRHVGRPSVAAAGGQAPEPAGDVAERDARREHVARRPERQPVAGDVPEGDDDREDQAAVEHAARPRQRQQVLRRRAELIEVDDEQQQLRADQRGDDDVDAEVEHARRVEPPLLGAAHRQPEPEQIGRGEQHAVGVDVIGPMLNSSGYTVSS